MSEDRELKVWFAQEIDGMLNDLYSAALRLAKNAADAEDLVGETVVRAFGNLRSLKDRRAFRGWMFRILSNCFVSECRKRKTRAEVSLTVDEDDDNDGEFWLFDKLHQPFLLWWGNPEQQFLNNLLRDDITKAVDALPENYRLVLVLAEIENFNYQDIADMLEIPIGTVRSRLSRARSLLQKTLWQHAKDRDIKSDPRKELNRQEPL